MAYVCELGTGQRLYLENLRSQTIVTLSSSHPGQQQQSSSRFETGSWTAPPEVMQGATGIVIKLATAQGDRWVQIQGTQMAVVAAPTVNQAQQIQVEPTEDSTSTPTLNPIAPMAPLSPMTMGNMQMSMNPMEMRMGDLSMQLASIPASAGADPAQPNAETRQFCTECGQPVKPDDRFCASCGHRLQ